MRKTAASTSRAPLYLATMLGIVATLALAPVGEGARDVMLSGSVNVVDQTWTCRSAVDLDSVTVTINAGQSLDAIHLEQGCTGRIGSIHVVTAASDGLKVNNATNLAIQGGSIICTAHNAGAHQDGIQAMAGSAVTFTHLTVGCTTANNSEFFVSQANPAGTPPTDIVCNQCYLYGTTSSTAFVTAHTVRSGVENSTLCPSPLTYRKIASDAIDLGNTYPSSCPAPSLPASSPPVTPQGGSGSSSGQPQSTGTTQTSPAQGAAPGTSAVVGFTMTRSRSVVTYGGVVKLAGTTPGPSGQTVAIYGWTPWEGAPAQVATTVTAADGSWHVAVTPQMLTWYEARVGALRSERVEVYVRPRVSLSYKHRYFVVRVTASGCCAGGGVVLQRRAGSRWINVRVARLGRHSTRTFSFVPPRGVSRFRAFISAGQTGPGYVDGYSRTVRVHRR